MPSAIDLAKRSLVGLLKRLALFYAVVVQLNRDSSEADVRTAYRKVSLKAHPDRRGRVEDQKALNAANDAWQDALKKGRSKPGRAAPAAPPADGAGAAKDAATGLLTTRVVRAAASGFAMSGLSCLQHPPHAGPPS